MPILKSKCQSSLPISNPKFQPPNSNPQSQTLIPIIILTNSYPQFYFLDTNRQSLSPISISNPDTQFLSQIPISLSQFPIQHPGTDLSIDLLGLAQGPRIFCPPPNSIVFKSYIQFLSIRCSILRT